ncbi:MAG: hypothetical protein RLZZ387_5163 [Chloroflexota bacterium]
MAVTILHLLDWAIIAVSFFNTVALLWLGLTVLLNAERRSAGTWGAGGGLLLAGGFFVVHSAVVGRDIEALTAEIELWWRVGWLPFIGGPYLWYAVIAWYTGVLRAGRHRSWLTVVSVLGLAALALLAFADPLPNFGSAAYQGGAGGWTESAIAAGVPAALLVYPVYSVLCIVLALLALRRPEASERFMGDVARRRARPWLIAASLALLAVSLAVGMAAAWLILQIQAGRLPNLSMRGLALVIGFDLLVSGLIAVITVLTGQAIVTYEVFTGKALPRGGLRRHWRRSLGLAAGYGALLGGSLALPVPVDPIWRLMLATVLMTLFFALLSWRSYLERDQGIARLRPFVASQHIYDQILNPEAAGVAHAPHAAPLRALCDEVLGATTARLIPLGPLAPLVPPLQHPPSDAQQPAQGDELPHPHGSPPPAAPEMPSALSTQHLPPGALCLPLEPSEHGGAEWAVPLWSERGLIGALLLGPKRDGGLYTQEEVELARATGERLIDAAAGAEMARRLMGLQRQRLMESQVIDRRTRRVLHDDVLPRIHELMLTLQVPTGGRAGEPSAVQALAEIHKQIADLLHAMPAASAPEITRLGLLAALRRSVEDELAGAFERVSWQIDGGAEGVARALPPLTVETAFYAAREAVRNAARHARGGRESAELHLTIAAHAAPQHLTISIEDDGAGMGASPSPGAGRGLELHSTMMAVVGGTLTVESRPGAFTRVLLVLPRAE